MSISKENVRHISKLARIELILAEEQKFGKELSAVLGFVEKLNEVNTENIAPLTGGTDLVNSMRKDEVPEDAFSREEKLERAVKLVNATPEHKDGFVKVKAV